VLGSGKIEPKFLGNGKSSIGGIQLRRKKIEKKASQIGARRSSEL
jgi:hypothetical protein